MPRPVAKQSRRPIISTTNLPVMSAHLDDVTLVVLLDQHVILP